MQSVKGNPELVRKYIFDAFMYARMGNPKLEEAAGDFLREGKKIPSVAIAFRNEAVQDHMHKMAAIKKMYSGKYGASDAFDRVLDEVGKAEASNKNLDAFSDFYDAMDKYYPYSSDIRNKIFKKSYRNIIKKAAKLLKL